ncbi:MAG: gltX2 [Planctomycetaceae bacterium]|nr:gltX2 [Planctomycetaceae bacterium]
MNPISPYRGRLAPTPTGYLHLGHARTFWSAYERARQAGGTLVLRDEDLDRDRCRPEYAAAMIEDLAWLGLSWQEGPDCGGPFAPYRQSERIDWYLEIWRRLAARGAMYPSPHSRKDVQLAVNAPQEGDSESLFPVALRPPSGTGQGALEPGPVNWRFRVPDGLEVIFEDGALGSIRSIAGQDFGDFLVWRKDGLPAYELAVVADDHAMQITEVVRGADLLTSTARQLLLYAALRWNPPQFVHCPLVRDAQGVRLAKRTHALALRTLKEQGRTPEEIRNSPLFQSEI